jgi:cell division transport system permease protein
MSVWLDFDVTASQKVAIEAKVRALPGVAGIACETGEQVYARFKETFKDSPDLIASVDPAYLPASCRFTRPDRAAADRASVELGALPGVDKANPLSAPTAMPSPTG